MGKKKNKDKPFNNPFAAIGEDLKKQIVKSKRAERKARAAAAVTPKPKPKPPSSPKNDSIRDTTPEDDAALFLAAVGDTPRMEDHRGQVSPPLPPPDASAIPIVDEDAEALAELASLVDGTAHFDITDSDEFIEGCRSDLDRRILSKLKRGDFAFRRHIDLHGMTKDIARDAVERFIVEARRDNQRCVLIVHGRGLNSKDNIPVLKSALKNWLERGRIGRGVLAFCTARNHDGGAGAVYVLLKK